MKSKVIAVCRWCDALFLSPDKYLAHLCLQKPLVPLKKSKPAIRARAESRRGEG